MEEAADAVTENLAGGSITMEEATDAVTVDRAMEGD